MVKDDGAAPASGEDNDLKKVAEEVPVIRIVDTLIKHAILEGASDIHIEPTEKDVIVRYRVDGILHDAMTLPRTPRPELWPALKCYRILNWMSAVCRKTAVSRWRAMTGNIRCAFRHCRFFTAKRS